MALRTRSENEIIYGRPHVASGISFLCKQSLRLGTLNNKINQCKYIKMDTAIFKVPGEIIVIIEFSLTRCVSLCKLSREKKRGRKREARFKTGKAR